MKCRKSDDPKLWVKKLSENALDARTIDIANFRVPSRLCYVVVVVQKSVSNFCKKNSRKSDLRPKRTASTDVNVFQVQF
jgi:hypothetical protein